MKKSFVLTLLLFVGIFLVFSRSRSSFRSSAYAESSSPPSSHPPSPGLLSDDRVRLLTDRFQLQADAWVDSVFGSLTPDQKIAQLMVIRESAIDAASRKVVFYDKEVEDAIRKYNIGGICLFQGGPLTQAGFINYFQSIAPTPLLVCIDAENGLGMRMDSVMGLPRQMMLGAMQDPDLVYEYGRLVGTQCKRMGIQVNYAPVVDVNNNPDNPVINDRSFGEDKYKVAKYGIQYMKGMQDVGIMACAKHFPGHGDVSVDSHFDLPVINKTRSQLDSLELYPFRELFKAGVGSVMIAHLYIPSIDNTPNQATSLSYKNVTKLLRKELHYKGISFTDALEMKGVAKYYPDGDASVQSLIAGNDMLCLPGDIAVSIAKINEAILHKKLKWKDIDARVKKVLYAKYQYGLAAWQPINMAHLTEDLNEGVKEMRRRVAENAITLVRDEDTTAFPIRAGGRKRIAYVGMGLTADNAFCRRMRDDHNANVYYFDYMLDSAKAAAALELLRGRYDIVVIGLHDYSRFPAGNFNISKPAAWLLQQLQDQNKTVMMAFGNPYAIKNSCQAKVLIACYEDDEITQNAAADLLNGQFTARGKLPVSVCGALKYGMGVADGEALLPTVAPAELGFDPERLRRIDSICKEAIAKQATPGCVVLVAKGGKIAYEKAFGYLTYDKAQPVYKETLYDLASVTKICATTMATMKLFDEGRLDLQKTLGDYLPWMRGSNKDTIRLWNLLLHQGGLKPFIPFSKETIDSTVEGSPLPGIYAWKQDSMHKLRVAEKLYIRNDWQDTINLRILQSAVGPRKYIYSDNDFILMARVVEAITGMTLDQYVKKTFYDPLGMTSTGFRPRERFPLARIAPTENEPIFRKQLLWGDVHDPGAAMFGEVSGHAGLFSDAYDLAVLEQMLLNGGSMDGKEYLKKQTIDYFTDYHSDISRRGIGFDKPEKDNATRKEPYPCLSASPETFGHTGFTGTCVWVDPKYDLIYIFLANRVNPLGGENLRLSTLSIRGRIQETIYQAMGVDAGAPLTDGKKAVKKRKKR
jgi:beta-glucosidase-like glycosyl hydrolase/CubicO group peptidase (beta-lactamase class C family)